MLVTIFCRSQWGVIRNAPYHLNDPRRRHRRRAGEIHHLTNIREAVELPCPVVAHH